MSLSLEFYSLDWADLARILGSRDHRLIADVLREIEPRYDEVFEDEDFAGGPDFEQGLERWVNGLVQADPRQVTVVEHLGDRLAFAALVAHAGRLAGTLQHSTPGGDLFRRRFLAGAAQRHLQPPFPLMVLLSRSIQGFESGNLPSWGGLNRDELAILAPRLAQDPPADPNDPDIDQWLLELWETLGEILRRGKELITIYA